MKLKFLTAFTCFTAFVLCATPPGLRADEKAPDTNEPAQEEPGDAQPPLSAEELEERIKEEAAQEKEQIAKMMKVFNSLEGSWTGRESLRYEEDRLPAKSWKDEWEGKFTFGGRYFEMLGQTAGEDLNSAYQWICTWDVALQRYRAWYFGDNSQNEYAGKLSTDGTHVIWSIKSPNGSTSRFTMKAEGNRVKCHGTDTLADGSLFSTQSSEYTRKRVEL
jgi:hypothetical protein